MQSDTVAKVALLACSNVLSKMMYFEKAGQMVIGHRHPYNHATLVATGAVKVTMTYPDPKNRRPTKIFKAPTMIYIPEGATHELVAMEDNTVCVCIHALRTIDTEILSPDFLVECIEDSSDKTLVEHKMIEEYGMPMQPLISPMPSYVA